MNICATFAQMYINVTQNPQLPGTVADHFEHLYYIIVPIFGWSLNAFVTKPSQKKKKIENKVS